MGEGDETTRPLQRKLEEATPEKLQQLRDAGRAVADCTTGRVRLERDPSDLERQQATQDALKALDPTGSREAGNAQVLRIAQRTAKLLGLERDLGAGDVELDDRYHGGVYGIPDERTLDAMRLAARLEGMITDPVYEGKSMAGMVDLVARGEIDATSNVLYAHLGGQPAINAYAALFS